MSQDQIDNPEAADINVKARDFFDRTALILAASYLRRDRRAVELLVKNGANVNAQDHHGKTALHHAVFEADLEIIEILLNFKADPNIKDNSGKDPLSIALYALKFGVVQLLADNGANVNVVNSEYGSTPLHVACRHKNLKTIKCLLKNGADMNARDNKGFTPLMHMIYSNEEILEETLTFTLKYADVNVNNSYGDHLLTYDVHEESWEIILQQIAKLLALGLTVNSKLYSDILHDVEYDEYLNVCTNELMLAKNTKLKNSWITYFDLLVGSRKKLKNYAGNEDLVCDFKNSDDRLNKFSIYGEQMRKNVEKGIKRREFFDRSSILLSDYIPIFNPNHLIVRDVLDYVSTKELSNFCQQNE